MDSETMEAARLRAEGKNRERGYSLRPEGRPTPLPGLRVLHDHEPRSAAMNMAIDEALLLTASESRLRFYGWRRPALSFGYFGRYADVANEKSQREIVRRWTGGGIVCHGSDLTYSVIVPRGSVAELGSPRVAYGKIHGAIRAALAAHLEVELAREDGPRISEACFANPVAADVLINGRKIAGAAQRRTRAGLLHQGSIQYEGLPTGFREAFARALGLEFSEITLDSEVLRRAEKLAQEKYGTSEWLEMR